MNSSYPNASTETMSPVGREYSGRSAFRFSNRREHSGEPARTASVAPAALPGKTRPRGRVLIATLMIIAFGGGAFTVWDSLFRYRAYGIVTGRIIEVAVPIEGVLTSLYVKEGDTVRQDAQLAKVVDLEFEQQLARVTDELRIADATLQAEIARVRWQSQVDDTEMTKSIAELYESTGRMHQESGSLDLLRNQLEQTKKLHLRNATTDLELSSFEIQEEAKQEELNSLQQWVVVLKERARRAAESPRLGAEQIQPMIAKSELLLNEISRLRERIAQGSLRSPVNGTVLRRYHPAGECIKSNEPLFSMIEESSLEVEVFLPQQLSNEYKIGDTIRLKIEPFDELVPCEVISIGAEHRRPPESIEVFYRSHVRLLPIRVKPVGEFSSDKKLSVGAVAKLPHFGNIL
jgi:multidrug resistance efflux pump